MTLLQELGDRRCWVVARVVHRADGKTDKLPTDPRTGITIDGQDRGNWITGHEADLWVSLLGPGFYRGIVIHPELQVFALDFDHCREPSGGWQPHVAAFLARFPGASIETSVSGAGLHAFIGYRGALPAHSVKQKLYRMEGYSSHRFILTTGAEASGSALIDHTPALARFLADYFPPKTAADDREGLWTNTPIEGGHTPEDDTELLQRALRSAGVKALMGAKAAFADLWYAQAEVLSRAYPSFNGSSPWDGSGADQALANHLAFWTRNDCERMLRLIRGSALRRDKWDRPDYLPRTILEACSKQTEWYDDGGSAPAVPATEPITAPAVSAPPVDVASPAPVESLTVSVPLPPATVPAPPPTVPTPPANMAPPALKPGQIPAPGTYMTIAMMQQMFDGFAWVAELNQIQLPNATTLAKDRFDVKYGGRQWAMTADGQKPSKSAWEAFTANELYEFNKVQLQCFRPGRPTGEISQREGDGLLEINCYKAPNIRRVQGDATPFVQHLQRLLPQDWELMLYTLAARVQYVGTKFMWHPYLQGCKGNGKTLIGKVLEHAIGAVHTHWPKSDQIDEKFNNVFSNKVLLIVDELPKNGYDIEPVLNTLSTATRLEVRPMYGEKVMKEVCFNLMFISNYQGSLQCDPDQRRYAPFFCAQQHKKDLARDGLTPAYFIEFRRWLESDGYAICAEYLATLPLPEHLTPSQSVRAPDTSATYAANVASRGAAEQELHHAIEQKLEGFRHGWISSVAVDMLLARVGKDKAIPRNAREALIESAGYLPHPSLPGGLCDIALPDGTRPRLYVVEGHPWAVDYLTVQQVRDGYLTAQKV